MRTLILIPWSGGIDSTGLIFKAHKEGVLFHTHFIEMRMERSIKSIFESRQVELLRNVIYKNHFHFDFSRSIFDLSLCPEGTHFWSEEVELFIISRLAVNFSKNFSNIEVWDGLVKDDHRNSSMTSRFTKRGSSSELLDQLTWEVDNIQFKTPFENTTKKEIWNDFLPEDVRNLTFSCESPLHSGKCGKCKDCVARKKLSGGK